MYSYSIHDNQQLLGYTLEGKLILTNEEIERDNMTMREALQRQVNQSLSLLAEMDNYPEEPNADQIVFLRMVYNVGGVSYLYAGVKNDNANVWYFTGKRTMARWPNGCTWEQLCAWITMYQYELWAATDYERLGGDL